MNKNNDIKTEYVKFMDEMIQMGYAEKVIKTNVSGGNEWYIPHFGVYHPQKKKVRVVYDCAAKINNISLNDVLYQGPDLTNSLLLVLMRFRLGEYAYTADIAKMFYQVRVPENDRRFLQFYWWSDGDTSRKPEVYHMNVHLFGASSSPSVATYALRRTALDRQDQYPETIINGMCNNFYVDDHLKASNSEKELLNDALMTRRLCAEGGFWLEKFESRSTLLMDNIPREAINPDFLQSANVPDSPCQRVLGVIWDLEEDYLKIDVEISEKLSTRRQLLKSIASIYDPLGIAASYVLWGRILLQHTCKTRLGWDDLIPKDLQMKM